MTFTRLHVFSHMFVYCFCFRRQEGNKLRLRRDLANVRVPRKETNRGFPRKEGEAAGTCFSAQNASNDLRLLPLLACTYSSVYVRVFLRTVAQMRTTIDEALCPFSFLTHGLSKQQPNIDTLGCFAMFFGQRI